MNHNYADSYPQTKGNNPGWLSPPMIPLLATDVDPIIDILTDADLEKELALYANAQFTFDKVNPCLTTPLINCPPNAPHLTSHRHRNPPLTLDIPLAITTNNACLKDHYSSTVSSPYDHQHQQQQQQYFTPLPSLPSSPTHDGIDQSQLLSFMMLSPTEAPVHHPPPSRFQEAYPVQGVDSASMHRSMSAHPNGLMKMADMPEHNDRATPKRRRTHSTPAQQLRLLTPDLDPPYEEEEEEVTADMVRLDKRRRNTAASARFRIKKKQREQTLQRTACEMTEKARFFENKVHELEREIKWLKDLLVAKNNFPC